MEKETEDIDKIFSVKEEGEKRNREAKLFLKEEGKKIQVVGELEMEEPNHTISHILEEWKGRMSKYGKSEKKKSRTHYKKEENKADEGET